MTTKRIMPKTDRREAMLASVDERIKQDMIDMRIIGSAELGVLLGRSTKSIQIQSQRMPDSLPPRFIVPGSKLLQWQLKTVRLWLEDFAAGEMRRMADAKERGYEFKLRDIQNQHATGPSVYDTAIAKRK